MGGLKIKQSTVDSILSYLIGKKRQGEEREYWEGRREEEKRERRREERKREKEAREAAQHETDLISQLYGGTEYRPPPEEVSEDYLADIAGYDRGVMAPVGPGGGPIFKEDVLPVPISWREKDIPELLEGAPYQGLLDVAPERTGRARDLILDFIGGETREREAKKGEYMRGREEQARTEAWDRLFETGKVGSTGELYGLMRDLDLVGEPTFGMAKEMLVEEPRPGIEYLEEAADMVMRYARQAYDKLQMNPDLTLDEFIAMIPKGEYDYYEVTEGFGRAKKQIEEERLTATSRDRTGVAAPPAPGEAEEIEPIDYKDLYNDLSWETAGMDWNALRKEGEKGPTLTREKKDKDGKKIGYEKYDNPYYEKYNEVKNRVKKEEAKRGKPIEPEPTTAPTPPTIKPTGGYGIPMEAAPFEKPSEYKFNVPEMVEAPELSIHPTYEEMVGAIRFGLESPDYSEDDILDELIKKGVPEDVAREYIERAKE